MHIAICDDSVHDRKLLCREGGITMIFDIRYDEDALPDKTRLGLILGNALQKRPSRMMHWIQYPVDFLQCFLHVAPK